MRTGLRSSRPVVPTAAILSLECEADDDHRSTKGLRLNIPKRKRRTLSPRGWFSGIQTTEDGGNQNSGDGLGALRLVTAVAREERNSSADIRSDFVHQLS